MSNEKNKVVLTGADGTSITQAILERLGKCENDYQVGWFEEATYKDEYRNEPIFVAQVAKWHEFGYHHPGSMFRKKVLGNPIPELFRVRAHDVPPRPMLWPVIREQGQRGIEKVAQAIAQGFDLDTALKQGAQFLLDRVKIKITTMTVPPNKPLTIYIKGSSHPMIDTGYLRSALRINKVKKGKK